MGAPQRYGFGAVQALAPGFGVGKWSRIATFGHKEQLQPDGSMREWEFTPSEFAAACANYARMFSQRRMGSDYEHQTARAALNGQPAPNLCFWNAMAVIEGDQVSALQEQQPGPAPDPAALRAMLAEMFPAADPDPSGLWMRCGEVTELGRLLIPNYGQLSPLFNDQQKDEAGQVIGFAVSNVSFVNVAHQDGTFFNFSISDGALHPSGPEQEKVNMDEKQMLAKLGVDGADKDAMVAAFNSYMAETDDGKDVRGAMAAAFKAKMAAFAEPFEGKETPEEEKKEEEAKKKAEAEMAAAQLSASKSALATLSQQHQQTADELAQLRAWKNEQEKQAKEQRLTTFAAKICSPTSKGGTGQWDPSKQKELQDMLRALPESNWAGALSGVPLGAFGGAVPSGRLFQGGNPAGQRRPGAAFNPPYASGQKTIGFSGAQQAFALLEQQGVKAPTYHQLADAMRQVAATEEGRAAFREETR